VRAWLPSVSRSTRKIWRWSGRSLGSSGELVRAEKHGSGERCGVPNSAVEFRFTQALGLKVADLSNKSNCSLESGDCEGW
jgi:hypothetical protein